MAVGIKTLRKVQVGWETVAGTAVATTAVMRVTGTGEDDTDVQFSDADVGYLGQVGQTYIASNGSKISMAGDATFEQITYPLAAGILTLTTGVTDTGGSGKVYTFTFPTTAANTIRTATIEAGDNIQAQRAAYCFVEGIKLSGKIKEPLKLEATWIGRAWADTSAFTTVALTTAEVILFNKATIALDTAGGTMGASVKAGTLLGTDIDIKTGNVGQHTGDGRLDLSFVKTTRPEMTIKVTFEHETAAEAERAAWLAQSTRKMRLLFTGASLTTAGTYTYKTLQVNAVGRWKKFDKIGDQDGDNTLTGTFITTFDATAPSIVVVNESATIA